VEEFRLRLRTPLAPIPRLVVEFTLDLLDSTELLLLPSCLILKLNILLVVLNKIKCNCNSVLEEKSLVYYWLLGHVNIISFNNAKSLKL
jgi:hypothetical protein